MRYKHFSRLICLAVVTICLLALEPGSALGGTVVLTPDVQIDVGIVGNVQKIRPAAVPKAGGLNQSVFSLVGSESTSDQWDLTWDMTVDTDPYINGVFGLTNNTGSTQTFVLNVTLPITPGITPSSLIGGSVGGSVTDANFDGSATVANAGGSPLFDGQIDGGSALPIIPSAFSFSAPFAGGTTNIPATNVGLPGPTIPGPAALSTIGISHTFTLTPGDSVSLTSFFVVVPEPASLMLLVSGVIAIAMKRRP